MTKTTSSTNGPTSVERYENGQVEQEEWLNEKGQLHREDGPAYVCYYENGPIRMEWYCVEDKWHREDGPSCVWYYENGQVKREEYHAKAELHREDGPAIINYDEEGNVTEKYYYIARCAIGLKSPPHIPISKTEQEKEKEMTEASKRNQYLVKRIEIPGKVLKMYEVPMVEGLATRMLKNYTLRVVLEEFLLEQIGEQVEDAFPVQCEENTERGSFFGVCPFMEDHRQCNWVTFYIEEEA